MSLRALIAAAVLCVSTPVYAQHEILLHYVDPGIRYDIPNVGMRLCYTLDEYKLVLKLDNNAYLQKLEFEQLIGKINTLDEVVQSKDGIIQSIQNERNIFANRADVCSNLLGQCQTELDGRPSFDWTSFVYGTLVGATAASVLVLVTFVSIR